VADGPVTLAVPLHRGADGYSSGDVRSVGGSDALGHRVPLDRIYYSRRVAPLDRVSSRLMVVFKHLACVRRRFEAIRGEHVSRPQGLPAIVPGVSLALTRPGFLLCRSCAEVLTPAECGLWREMQLQSPLLWRAFLIDSPVQRRPVARHVVYGRT
jgi:hypothetical protein